MNLSYDPVEQRMKAAQFGNIVRDAPYWEAVFEARLAHKLEGLGYVIERRGGKDWEIAGVPRSVIGKFSKRTDEIETEAERLGIVDPNRKGELGAKTRQSKKKRLTPDQLRMEWDRQLTDPERQRWQWCIAERSRPVTGSRTRKPWPMRFTIVSSGNRSCPNES